MLATKRCKKKNKFDSVTMVKRLKLMLYLPWCLCKILEWHKQDAWGIQQSTHHLLPLDLLWFQTCTQNNNQSCLVFLITISLFSRLTNLFTSSNPLFNSSGLITYKEKAYTEVVRNHKSNKTFILSEIWKWFFFFKPVVSAFPKGFSCRESSPRVNLNWPA